MTKLPKSNQRLFAFDLDATITKREFLPMLAQSIGLAKEIETLTESAMRGDASFERNFRTRVELLKEIPVSKACAIAAQIPLHEKIVAFIQEHPHRCMIVTGNLDVWITPMIDKLGMQGRCFCSRASVCQDYLTSITTVLDKAAVCDLLPRPFVAIGDGKNDVDMLKAAEIGIAFGGVHQPSKELLAVADMVIWEENELVDLLKTLL